MDRKKILSNKVNKNLSEQMIKLFKDKFCPTHPNYENTSLVNMQKEGDPIAIVESFCCDNFKRKLDLIAENKNPFPNSKE